MNFKVSNEIVNNFIPHYGVYEKGKECVGWRKSVYRKNGRKVEYYVEVRNPAYKLEKTPSSHVQIISNITGITGSQEYNLETLKFLLNALNRSQ